MTKRHGNPRADLVVVPPRVLRTLVGKTFRVATTFGQRHRAHYAREPKEKL